MNRQLIPPTLLGTVQDVTGSTVSIILNDNHLSGLIFVHGQGYRVGQLGSFVKIPLGYIDLFGIVTHVGASAVPERMAEQQPYGYRWIRIQLVGEGSKYTKFQRGISQYPTVEDDVYLVSEQDLALIYGHKGERNHLIKIGHIVGSESIDAMIDINKLTTRHSTIVGTTGSGKSTTVSALLSVIADNTRFPSARLVILDLHGEYGKAVGDNANIFKLTPNKQTQNEKKLFLPFWALSFDELIKVTFGELAHEGKARNIILEKILAAKEESAIKYYSSKITLDNLTVDSPIPFSLNMLWYELYGKEFGTYYSTSGQKPDKENWAYEIDQDGKKLIGNAQLGIPPRFKPVKNVKEDTEKINYLPDGLGIRTSLENLGAKLRIPRFDFLLRPGEWMPESDGKTEKDLSELIKGWIGSEKPITIFDLSGVPNLILNDIIGILLRILYDCLFWSRNLPQGGRERPLLIVMEEAHSYLQSNSSNSAASMVKKIVKEGRKYGIGAMVISQRPSEIDPTILSQCGTFIAMRLSNGSDRAHITSTLPDNLEGITDMLPILKTGEAIILGEAVELPMRCTISAPSIENRPDSNDPIVCDKLSPEESTSLGGWNIPMEPNPNYDDVCFLWRQQDPVLPIKKDYKMSWEEYSAFDSSNISLLRYNSESSMLEVSFHHGGIYQYFDVPQSVWEDFKSADSKGKFLHSNIKGRYRYSRV
jgi:energy-coupling factor transporter ATP-binding protein EcfA2